MSLLSKKRALQWKASLPADANLPVPLLTLPPELRAMILGIILVRNCPIVNVRPRLHKYDPQLPFDPFKREPYTIVRLPKHQRLANDVDGALLATNVMATCHQLHVEGAQLLHSCNTFQAQDAETVHYHRELFGPREMVALLHPAYASLVRRIQVHADWVGCRYQQTGVIRDVLRKWPHVGIINLTITQERLDRLHVKVSVQNDRAKAVARIALEVRSIFSMADMKIPKELKVVFKVILSKEGRQGSELEEVSAFAEQVLQMAKTMRGLRY